jgi:hypothetical protein
MANANPFWVDFMPEGSAPLSLAVHPASRRLTVAGVEGQNACIASYAWPKRS